MRATTVAAVLTATAVTVDCRQDFHRPRGERGEAAAGPSLNVCEDGGTAWRGGDDGVV